jgi:hypothetical protein
MAGSVAGVVAGCFWWVVLLHSDASWVLLHVAYGCVALWQVFMVTV